MYINHANSVKVISLAKLAIIYERAKNQSKFASPVCFLHHLSGLIHCTLSIAVGDEAGEEEGAWGKLGKNA